jgi:iron complex outermembrane receptor protein
VKPNFHLKIGTAIMLSHPAIALADPQARALPPSPPSDSPQPPSTTVRNSAISANQASSEIIVTATRRSESVQKVPISMEVVSAKRIDAFHPTDLRSVLNTVPNVYIATSQGNDVIYIRGFGSAPANFAFDQSVATYVDGIYAGKTRQVLSPFFDLERTEVLRGPQGALYGKNTAAGAVNIVTANPADHVEGAVTGVYNINRFKGYDIGGHLSGPLGGGFSARLAVRLVHEDGFIHNLATGNDDPRDRQQVARLTLRYSNDDNFDYTVKANYGHERSDGAQSVSSSLLTPQMPQLHNYIAGGGPLGDNGYSTSSALTSGTGNIKLGDFTLTSVTGYSWFKVRRVNYTDQLADGVPEPTTLYIGFSEHFRQFSQELRVLSPSGRKLEFIGGAYFDTSTYELGDTLGFNFGPPQPFTYQAELQSDLHQKSWSYSVYGQATYHILDSLRLVGSLRYTHTIKDGGYTARLAQGAFSIIPLHDAAGRINEGHVDPSATLQYDLARHVMVYATYGRGSKSGGFVGTTFGIDNSNFTYKPERSENYEVGVKTTFLGGHATFNTSLYKTTFKDLQVAVANPATSNFDVSNAASASSKGIEAMLSWAPTRNFDLNASATYQNTKFDNYPGAACLAKQPISECDPSNLASVLKNNIAGEPLTYAAKFSGSVQAHHRLELPGELRLDSTVSVYGRTKYYSSDTHSPLYGRQPGYAKLDARLEVGPHDGKWHVALVGKNLTNKLVTESSFEYTASATAFPRAFLLIEDARKIALEAGLKF